MKFSAFIISTFICFGIVGAPVFAQSNATDSGGRQQSLAQLESAKQELISLLLSQVRVLQVRLSKMQAEQGQEISSGSADANTISSLKVVYPNGGEVLSKEKPYRLQWSSTGLSKDENIYVYLIDSNGVKQNLPIVRTVNTGSYLVLFNRLPVGSYKLDIRNLPEGIRDSSKVVSDTSDSTFEIVAKDGDSSQTAKPSTSGLSGYCGEYYDGVNRPIPTDPAFTAYGLRKVEISLDEANRRNSYFKLLGNPSYVPSYRDYVDHILPGWHLSGQNAGSYLTIPMTPTAAGKQWSFFWYENQDSMLDNTNLVVSLSPCPGDFRGGIRRNDTGDKYLGWGCRKDGTAERYDQRTFAVEGSGWQGCPIPAGKTLYLNITNHRLPHSPVIASCEGGVCTPGVTITTPKPLCEDEGICGMRFSGLPIVNELYIR